MCLNYGLEYKNTEIKIILSKFGIRHETSVLNTSQQNRKSEQSMLTIVEPARTLINSKIISITLWAEAVNTVVYVLSH